MGMHVQVCKHMMQRQEVYITCFPLLLSTLFLQSGSLTKPEAQQFDQTSWPGSPRNLLLPVPTSPALTSALRYFYADPRDQIQIFRVVWQALYQLTQHPSSTLCKFWCKYHSIVAVDKVIHTNDMSLHNWHRCT